MTVVTLVCQEAARRALQGERPALEAEVTLAEERASAAREAAAEPQRLITHLERELAQCQQYAADIEASAGHDASVASRIRYRADRLAIEAETQETAQQLQDAHRAAEPALNALRQATTDLARTKADLASLNAAIAEPWATERGRNTDAYRVFSLRSGLWAESDGPVARGIVDTYLRRGYGAQLERNAIKAYLAGDPRARSAGDVKHFGDHTLINTGDVPVVAHGAAQPGWDSNRPPVPQQAPTGEQVMSGARTGVGQMPASTVTKARTASVDYDVELPSAIRKAYR